MIVQVALLLAIAGAPNDRDQAKAEFDGAQRHYQVGRFEEALAGYTRSYELVPLPALLFNIAQCHRNLGQRDRAIYFMEQYLERQPDAKNREAVERLIDELRREEEQERARVRVETRTTTVTVTQFVEPEREVYEQWWFWTAIGVMAVAAAGGTALALSGGSNVPPGLGEPIVVPPR